MLGIEGGVEAGRRLGYKLEAKAMRNKGGGGARRGEKLVKKWKGKRKGRRRICQDGYELV